MSVASLLVSDPPRLATEDQIGLWEKIAGWDMSRERLYMANRLGYTDEAHLTQMEIEYKRFVFLLCVYRDVAVPMADQLDDFWHVTVLHTRNYTAFCQAVFGGYIHHNPTVSDEENTALWPAYVGNTLPLYEKHFGAPSADFWDRDNHTTPCCTN